MKKILIILLIALALTGISCKTTAPAPASGPVSTYEPVIEGDVTQAKVNEVLTEIYNEYRDKLDLSDAQEYTVVRGDTLSQITRNYYGNLRDVGEAGPNNGFYFPVIMMASNSIIVDPDLIDPGMKLVIIDLKKNLDNPGIRKAIKECLIDVAYVYNKKGIPVTEEGLKKLAESL